MVCGFFGVGAVKDDFLLSNFVGEVRECGEN